MSGLFSAEDWQDRTSETRRTATGAVTDENYPADSVGADEVRRAYVRYLTERYLDCQQLEVHLGFEGGVPSYASIFESVEVRFGISTYFVSVARFEELVAFLQSKIEQTVLGRSNRARGIKNYDSSEVFLRIQSSYRPEWGATPTSLASHRTVEGYAIEKYIRDAGRFIEEARLNPDIAEGFSDAGYDDEVLSRGMELQEKAWSTFCAIHSEFPPNRERGEAELDAKVEAARDDWAAFRLIARAAFTSLDARLNLRVMGDVPEDLQRFVNVAHAGYQAASEDPFTEKLSKRGYTPENLKSLSGVLDSLASLAGALDATKDVARGKVTNIEEGDAAYVELKEYMKEIKGVARAVFRRNPEILSKLAL